MQNPFGTTLREARRRVNANLLQLATSADVSVAYVSQVERGEKNPPCERIILCWLRALNCEERLNEFLNLANLSVKSVQVSTNGKSQTATNVLASLARSYEKNEIPDDVWKAVENLISSKRS